jgi:hypothetical protein
MRSAYAHLGPPTWFLPTLAVSSPSGFVGLLHPTTDHEVHRVLHNVGLSFHRAFFRAPHRCTPFRVFPSQAGTVTSPTRSCPLAVAECESARPRGLAPPGSPLHGNAVADEPCPRLSWASLPGVPWHRDAEAPWLRPANRSLPRRVHRGPTPPCASRHPQRPWSSALDPRACAEHRPVHHGRSHLAPSVRHPACPRSAARADVHRSIRSRRPVPSLPVLTPLPKQLVPTTRGSPRVSASPRPARAALPKERSATTLAPMLSASAPGGHRPGKARAARSRRWGLPLRARWCVHQAPRRSAGPTPVLPYVKERSEERPRRFAEHVGANRLPTKQASCLRRNKVLPGEFHDRRVSSFPLNGECPFPDPCRHQIHYRTASDHRDRDQLIPWAHDCPL